MTLIIQKPTGAQLRMRKTWQPMDPDAAAYITAVEAADGQALEEKTKIAIDNFVLGCKQDGIWTAIKASCILSGARTLSGALVPLVGSAPTNPSNVFVEADYNRKTGLAGNGSTKYLNSNRAINADPATNQHVSVYLSTYAASTWLGAATGGAGYTSIESNGMYCGSVASISVPAGTTGLIGASRNDPAFHSGRRAGATLTNNNTAISKTSSLNYPVFAYLSSTTVSSYSSARIAFYSIGEALDLAKLDARVTDLINAFGAAIP